MKNGAVRKKKHLQTFRAFGIHIWILFKNVVYDFHVFLFNCHVKGSAKLKSRNNILFFLANDPISISYQINTAGSILKIDNSNSIFQNWNHISEFFF